jgi:hypothetical protein
MLVFAFALVMGGCLSAPIISYNSTPSKVFSGIKAAQLNGSKLILTLVDKGVFEEYSAPKYGNTRYGDETKKVMTGKSKWGDALKVHRFLISGFDKDYEFGFPSHLYERLPASNQVVIDLMSAIINTQLTSSTTINVTCLDCNLPGSEEQNIFKNAKASVELNSDFRRIKPSLVEAQKVKFADEERIKLEQVKRDKEKSKLSELRKTESLKAEQPLQSISIIEKAKDDCAKMYYKPGTEKFGNCVLMLTK